MRFLAYHAKGVGDILEWEILERVPGVEIVRRSEKYILFETRIDNVQDIVNLRTADDAQLLLADRKFESRPVNSEIIEEIPLRKLEDSFRFINDFRSLEREFSITLSR
ncbi:MAG: hypothetical protein ABEJ56_04360 [Candidatus Nanohaloarchaea archaeon]